MSWITQSSTGKQTDYEDVDLVSFVVLSCFVPVYHGRAPGQAADANQQLLWEVWTEH